MSRLVPAPGPGRARSVAKVLASLPAAWAAACALVACRDVSRFSTHGDHYEGSVVQGSFVRAGIADDTRLCLSLDADHLQDAPGSVSSSDGRFRDTPLRPIPQLWHDPLSTLSFGEGRTRNLVYVATAAVADGGGTGTAGGEGDVMLVVSLMQSGDVEVRALRGAPPTAEAGAAGANVFGVFTLARAEGPCSF